MAYNTFQIPSWLEHRHDISYTQHVKQTLQKQNMKSGKELDKPAGKFKNLPRNPSNPVINSHFSGAVTGGSLWEALFVDLLHAVRISIQHFYEQVLAFCFGVLWLCVIYTRIPYFL